ncbi:MAG: Maf family protein [Gammaproteobacteria bacterium]|nr:Maf family protein [Gammaproteobacteria bacterium]
MNFSTPIVLASSSRYRKELLERLNLPFACQSPDIDESQLHHEAADTYVKRLANGKANALAEIYPNHLIIGSDQCSVVDKRIVGKPGTREAAIAQLEASSGKTLTFLTGLAVINPASGWQRTAINRFEVEFRDLSRDEIERYIDAEQPLDCAGSFKSERLGISLTRAMRGDDPSALVGLPLIQLSSFLREYGVNCP